MWGIPAVPSMRVPPMQARSRVDFSRMVNAENPSSSLKPLSLSNRYTSWPAIVSPNPNIGIGLLVSMMDRKMMGVRKAMAKMTYWATCV